MLYNESTGKTKVDVFSLQGLIAWLETMPAKKRYCYVDHGRCLLSQYFTSLGFRDVYIASCGYWEHDGKSDEYPLGLDDIACGCSIGDRFSGDHTFGAALERARRDAALQMQERCS